jgi:hypothetical protein
MLDGVAGHASSHVPVFVCRNLLILADRDLADATLPKGLGPASRRLFEPHRDTGRAKIIPSPVDDRAASNACP